MRGLNVLLSLSLILCASAASARIDLEGAARKSAIGDDICAHRIMKGQREQTPISKAIKDYLEKAGNENLLQMIRPVNVAAHGYAAKIPQVRYQAEMMGMIFKGLGETFAKLSKSGSLTDEQSRILARLGDQGVLIFQRESSSTSGMGIRSEGFDQFPDFKTIRDFVTVVEIPSDNSMATSGSWGGRYGIREEFAIFPVSSRDYVFARDNLLGMHLNLDLKRKLREGGEIVRRFAGMIASDLYDQNRDFKDPLAIGDDYIHQNVYREAMVNLSLWQSHMIEFNSYGYIPFPDRRKSQFFYYRKGKDADTLEVFYNAKQGKGGTGIADTLAGELKILRDRIRVEEVSSNEYGGYARYVHALVHVAPSSGDE